MLPEVQTDEPFVEEYQQLLGAIAQQFNFEPH
jgi:hypothetical protein